MHLNFILSIILFRYLQTHIETKKNFPDWSKYFFYGMIGSIILMILGSAIGSIRPITTILAHIVNFSLVYLSYDRKLFAPINRYVNAFLPLLLVNLAEDIVKWISQSSFQQISDYFEAAGGLSLIWLVAMWFIIRRQQKALEKERHIAEEKEKEIQQAEKMQLLLENQVSERTLELTNQKEELIHALDDLKSTQTQLVHAEKMASLGELTAGIAHEIQNPLNFVNNFSEVSHELVDEMYEGIENGDIEEVKAIAHDLKQNLEKIAHHGKRADSIVKGMLSHSRSSTGEKILTDINALADEYLRLSYHGLRAKDTGFNADMELDLDESIGMLEVVQQDIGRVFLNLITNAFQACHELSKTTAEAGDKLIGKVRVKTKNLGDQIEIIVSDNGLGIPDKIQDKIFQPFFTTKPTGEGTGLGLSLAFDIVSAHGGTLEVESELGEGTAFRIVLPVD